MKTTLDSPDESIRAVKVRAAEENVNPQAVIASPPRLSLAADSTEKRTVRTRVQFPLVACPRPAKPGEELTPERVAAILAEGELSALSVANLVASEPG